MFLFFFVIEFLLLDSSFTRNKPRHKACLDYSTNRSVGVAQKNLGNTVHLTDFLTNVTIKQVTISVYFPHV
jgi:hypothetical protein